MDWVKIYGRHLHGMKKLEKAALVEIQLLTAFLERIPTDSEMVQATSEHLLFTIRQVLEGRSTTLRQVLDMVLEDVQGIIDKRLTGKARAKKSYDKAKNEASSREEKTASHEAEKIREEKIREDKKENTLKWQAPSLLEVSNYCKERNNGINPEAFIAFYESKGWMVGKNKMKNWKSAIHTWEARTPKPKVQQAYKLYTPVEDNEQIAIPSKEDLAALKNFNLKGVN